MLDYTIRDSGKGDLDFILGLIEQTFKECIIEAHGEWNEAGQRVHWQNTLDSNLHKIIEVDNTPIGLYAAKEDANQVILDLLFITPEYQGNGIGSALVDQLIADAKKKSKSLTLDVLKSNTKAKTFYEDKGFSVIKEDTKRFYLQY